MPDPDLNTQTIYGAIPGGAFLDREYVVRRATASLPQTTAAAIFNVIGGAVEITQILGIVTTAIQNQANNTKLIANPSSGTSVDMCAVLDIANDEAGTIYSITGTLSGALAGTAAGAVAGQATPVIVQAGTIDLSCAASNTGAIRWIVKYRPLDEGAYVTAA